MAESIYLCVVTHIEEHVSLVFCTMTEWEKDEYHYRACTSDEWSLIKDAFPAPMEEKWHS